CHVSLASRRNAEQEQSRATADLENLLRAKRRNFRYSHFDPLEHFVRWNRLPCITAIPAGYIEARLRRRCILSHLRQVKGLAPSLDAFALLIGFGRCVCGVIVVREN